MLERLALAAGFLCMLLLTPACTTEKNTPEEEGPMPPMAEKKPHQLEKHGHVRSDPYYWLKERESPEVINYLNAENAYVDARMGHTKALQEKLFEEIKGRIKQNDESVPYKLDDYYYYTRYEEGKQYPIYCRKKGSLEAAEEIMLDVNQIAEGKDFTQLGNWQISADQNILAYAVDFVGRRKYDIYFKDLTTGELHADVISEVTPAIAWGNDNQTVFYTKQEADTLRARYIYRHVLGSGQPAELVYDEKDETFGAWVYRTKSKKYIMISCYQTLSNEYHFLDADNPGGTFQVVQPRERGLEYGVDHYGDNFYISTNENAENFKLVSAPVTNPGKENWQEVIPHRDDVFLAGFEIFRDHLVVRERNAGLIQMRIIPWSGGDEHYLDFGEPAYQASFGRNPDFNTAVLRYSYSSLTTPNSTYDYHMTDREKTLKKRTEVLGGFQVENYTTERLMAKARDGVLVPVSLVYRKDMFTKAQNPLLVYGYGSYGATIDPRFQSTIISLLDRGFVYAIAHIRGGQVMGRQWYENGKLLTKKNTFTDFIDATKHLVAEGYGHPEKVFARGGSAGGLLMGAVVNMAPELYLGIISDVPFVDVITTMLDASIPLTTGEYDEWGDPNQKEYYDYILSYSPYDNVEAKAYPNMLVTTGLHDSQVQYWEPAKWVAKLRDMKTDNNMLLLKTNMDAGHGGASGRYEAYKEAAFDYTFMLNLLGMTE